MTLTQVTERDGKRIGHFAFRYQAPRFSHTREILYDLDARRVLRATAVKTANSNGQTATTTMAAELIE